jgi:hypothetical protein
MLYNITIGIDVQNLDQLQTAKMEGCIKTLTSCDKLHSWRIFESHLGPYISYILQFFEVRCIIYIEIIFIQLEGLKVAQENRGAE